MTADPRVALLIMTLRRHGVSDTAVLRAIESVDRARFVPPHLSDYAWEDRALPVELGQTISQPSVVALMTEALDLARRDLTVLEIGTGTGYQAAVLAELVDQVITLERHGPLAQSAAERLIALGYPEVSVVLADGALGWPEAAPYDRILITAACPGEEPPSALIGQLAEGGILVAPVTLNSGEQEVVKLLKTRDGLQFQRLWPVRFVPLAPGVAPAGLVQPH